MLINQNPNEPETVEDKPISQPPELSKVGSEIESYYKTWLLERQKNERQWYMNMAFFLGYQRPVWNTITQQFKLSTLDPDHRRRVTVNKIQPSIMKEVGRMARSKPKYFVVPEDDSEDCKAIAKVGEEILDFLEQELKLQILNTNLRTLLCIYGTAFKDIFWDKYAGGTITDEMTGEEVPTGEVGQEILGPFNIVLEPGVCEMKDAQRAIIVKARSIEWVKQTYPDWAHLVKPEADRATSAVEKQLNILMNGANQSVVRSASEEKNNSGFVNVIEYRELPCEKYPNGRIVVVANKVTLASGDLPMQWMIKDKNLGLLKYGYIKVPGMPYDKSYIEACIPSQRGYNDVMSILFEYIKTIKGKVLEARGQNVSQIDNEVGQIVKYDIVAGAGKPEFMSPPPLPAYIENMLDRCTRDISDITSQHEISKAQTPPGITAGVAIQTLAELDDTQYSSVHMRFEDTELQAAMMMIKTVKEKYTETRKMALVNKEGDLSVKYFDKATIEQLPTKIIVQRGSSLPQLKSAKQAQVIDLVKIGLYNPEKDKTKILKMLEFGNISEEIDEATADEKRAKLENTRIVTELPIMVEVFDEHSIHIQYHNDYRKTADYEKLTPEQKEKIDSHVYIHGGALSGELVNEGGQWVNKAEIQANMDQQVQSQEQQAQQLLSQAEQEVGGQTADQALPQGSL
jgi:hypothetical protein